MGVKYGKINLIGYSLCFSVRSGLKSTYIGQFDWLLSMLLGQKLPKINLVQKLAFLLRVKNGPKSVKIKSYIVHAFCEKWPKVHEVERYVIADKML